MKTIGKILLWILGIIAWFFFLMMFWMADLTPGTTPHLLILTFTAILLAIYLLRGKTSGASALEKENQALKAEVQKLRKELEARQAVAAAIEKSEQRED